MAQTAMPLTVGPSYFDSLNEKEMKKVFRHLSDCATHPCWSKMIPSGDMTMALKTYPRLRALARKVLSRLSTYPPSQVFALDNEPCVVHWSKLCEVLHAAGDELHELRLGFGHISEILELSARTASA